MPKRSHSRLAITHPRCGPFARFATKVSRTAGHPLTFASAVAVVVGWALLGPVFHFSDTWQLVINTSTTIVTFLMVFLIQHSQNRDTAAVQIKLDELIWATVDADNRLLDLEELDQEHLDKLREHYESRAREARHALHAKGHGKKPPAE